MFHINVPYILHTCYKKIILFIYKPVMKENHSAEKSKIKK